MAGRSSLAPILATALLATAPYAAERAAMRAGADRRETLAAQVLLDRRGISPGEIDGRLGTNTRLALAAFREEAGLPPAAGLDERAMAALRHDDPDDVLTRYTIEPRDLEGPFVERIPEDMMEQASLPGLFYTSPLEEIGERFHASPSLLKALNPGASFAAGETILVPAVGAPRPTDGIEAASVTVIEHPGVLQARDGEGRLLLHAPVTAGSAHDPLPLGQWHVTGISHRPDFLYNPDLFWDSEPTHSKARIRPGPNNPVGLVWIGIDREHYGIHGTAEPGRIGHGESHGCVRLTNWDALALARMVRRGTPVVFR